MKRRITVQKLRPGVRQERAAPGLVVTRGSSGAGSCTYGPPSESDGLPTVAELNLPDHDSARDQVIRLHELLHAAHPRHWPEASQNYHPLVVNTAEDMILHARYWPDAGAHLTREACAVAVQDARYALSVSPTDPEVADDRSAMLFRTLAVAHGAGMECGRYYLSRTSDSISKAVGWHTAIHALEYAKNAHECEEDYRRLLATLCGAMIGEARKAAPGTMAEHNVIRRSTLASKLAHGTRGPDRTGLYATRTGDKGARDEGTPDAFSDPMEIVQLEFTAETNPRTGKRWRPAASGSRLNAPAIVRSLVTCDSSRLFKRQKRAAGGTVLIDASGSMSFSAARLALLCRMAPSSTVAYYHGCADAAMPDLDGGRYFGRLIVFARDGRRADVCPRDGSGNDVDVWAIRWLLSQEAPRVIVTDRGFCGGPVDQETGQDQEYAARDLLCEAEQQGLVTTVQNVIEAEGLFSKRQGLSTQQVQAMREETQQDTAAAEARLYSTK